MVDKVQKFFDNNSSFYGDDNIFLENEYHFLNFIKKTQHATTTDKRLLDIGGGSGAFAKIINDNIPDMKIIVMDISKNMLFKIDNDNIDKVIGMLPDTIPFNKKFDYVHVKEVFHHVTKPTIKETRDALKRSLVNIREILSDDGYLLVHEVFYESYLYPQLSSRIIYWLCKLQNKTGLKIPVDEFIMSLEVYFYTRAEFKKILSDSGYIIINCDDDSFKNSIQKKVLFIKDWGRMYFICKKRI